jgi:hypothetical protein
VLIFFCLNYYFESEKSKDKRNYFKLVFSGNILIRDTPPDGIKFACGRGPLKELTIDGPKALPGNT